MLRTTADQELSELLVPLPGSQTDSRSRAGGCIVPLYWDFVDRVGKDDQLIVWAKLPSP